MRENSMKLLITGGAGFIGSAVIRHIIKNTSHSVDKHNLCRQLSKKLGIILGKVDYCLQSLIQKGFVKINNFKNSKHKFQYSYLLTPKGIKKTKLTIEFLKAKTKEYEALKEEVEGIKNAEKSR